MIIITVLMIKPLKKQSVEIKPCPVPADRLSSRDLLKGRDRLLIEHNGEQYTLRITRNDKLILTK
jgi:hemin uptake protein HemP